MSNIKLKNLLSETMHRFGTKNLNEAKLTAVDEKPMSIKSDVVILDSPVTPGIQAQDAINFTKEWKARLLTKSEMQSFLEKSANAFNQSDMDLPTETTWRAWILDAWNSNMPILWDLQTNKEATQGMLATRFVAILNNPNLALFN
jgi:hypothetical protein